MTVARWFKTFGALKWPWRRAAPRPKLPATYGYVVTAVADPEPVSDDVLNRVRECMAAENPEQQPIGYAIYSGVREISHGGQERLDLGIPESWFRFSRNPMAVGNFSDAKRALQKARGGSEDPPPFDNNI